jgi:16S rRNA C967 or C1407 C5-methylase (RsmB/RsmF family)
VADYSYTESNNDEEEKEIVGEEEHHPKLKWYDSFQEAKLDGMADIHESMWPSSNENEPGAQDLSNCLRLFPQDQDTGGFFVSLIKRLR